MEAALPDEEVAIVFEPAEHLTRQSSHFIVTEVHQQPVGEDDVILTAGQLQFSHVGLQKLDMGVMTIALAVAIDVVLHEINRRQTTCQRSQVIRKPPSNAV